MPPMCPLYHRAISRIAISPGGVRAAPAQYLSLQLRTQKRISSENTLNQGAAQLGWGA